tara:strand:- start:32635 stop:34713 length:2079 start_codon:yes stop_codon:yes gene_type:complete
MVTTRRKAAALNEALPLQPSTTTRRTRSKAAASPLKTLDNVEPAPKATKNKRKRNAATPEPVADESDDEGLFFKQSMPQISLAPSPRLNAVLIAPQEVVQSFVADPRDPEAVYRENAQLGAEHIKLRYEILDLRREASYWRERFDATRSELDALLAGQAKEHRANHPQPTTDYDSFMGDNIDPTLVHAEFITGSESAFALLHHIESAAREPRTVYSENEGQEAGSEPAARSPQADAPAEEPTNTVTPSLSPRAISQPTGFFGRSFSAIKSKLGFPTATPSESAPTPSSAPPPNTITETLSTPPTPVGERKKATHKRKRQSPMMRLLTKGVESSDMKDAQEWAKHVIPALKNDADFESKRTRLETPVLAKDLNSFPSSKPWEAGFGDPLGDLDDDEIVPVWAVYLDILAEADEPRKKKTKTSHDDTMDVDDALSLNDMVSASSSPVPSSDLHNTHGNSASELDLHPRRSVEPSPMFGSSPAHKQGSNIFRERQGQEATAQLRAEDRNTLHEATKKAVPKHNPSQGSYGLDYDSDDDTTISETTDADVDGAATPLWTQPPPPAPVPAHAPLPGASAADSAAVLASQQPVDEVERQRQKLMKHTPAKPSRLREAFVPSPSLISDAGNESIFMTSPVPATDLFDDMPDAEDLGLDDDILAEVERLRNTDEWKAEAAKEWPDAIVTYESEEEGLSPD